MPGPRGRGPRGGFGGRGPRGGFGGFSGYNWTMSDANSARDMQKTLGNPMPVGGLAGTGYVSDENDFSFFDVASKLKIAWSFSYHSNGASRIRSFFGNYRVLSHDASKVSRLQQISASLTKRHNDGEIDDQTFGERIMYEADRYFGWLYRNTAISYEQYREKMLEFADSHEIDYSFGDEDLSRTR